MEGRPDEGRWNSTYEAGAPRQAPLSLARRTNTCPGNAPVKLSWAAGLAQGGERGHCKGNRERPVSRRRGRAQEAGGQAPPVPTDPEWQSGHVWQQRSRTSQDHAAAATAARAAPELLPAQSPRSSASVSIPSGQTRVGPEPERVPACHPVAPNPLPLGPGLPPAATKP